MREFELLQHIYEANPGLPEFVLIPPGDDMALLRLPGGGRVLAAVDQLVAGTHFDPKTAPIELVGRKSITRCLSDVAAMAGRPTAALAAATLPAVFGAERARSLFDAMRTTAERYGCPLVGGDVAVHRADDGLLVCSVTVLAEVVPEPITRSGARPGDTLYVTGVLGGALESKHHLTFEPRIDEAIELATTLGDRLHAMIDLSDGLGRDADHIAVQSGVQIVIDVARLPCRGDLEYLRALSDGEDYELCFAACGNVPATLGGVPVTAVGLVVATGHHGDERLLLDLGKGRGLVPGGGLGWQHES